MHNDEEKRHRTPRKMPGGGPPGMGAAEKAKDFKKATKRLIQELKPFKVFIIISLILAMFGAILSLSAPNKISDLTDEISKGLVVNKDNLEILQESIKKDLNEENISKKIPEILDVNFSQEKIISIMNNSDISFEDKKIFQESMLKLQSNDLKENISGIMAELPESILKNIFEDTTYEEILVSKEDKISLIKKNSTNTLPASIMKALLTEVEIDGVKISTDELYETVNVMSDLKEDTDVNTLYSKIDTMPENVKKVIEPKMNLDTIKKLTIFLVSLYVISALFTYIESICMTDVANNFARDLRSRISKKINKLPLKYFDKHSKGDILSRVTNDVDTIAQSMNQSLATLVSNVTLFIGSMIMMFYTNWILAFTAVLSSLIGFIGMGFILKKSQKYFTARQEELGKLNGHIEEIYSGLNVVKVYNAKDDADKKFDDLNEKVRVSNEKSQFLSGLMQPMMNFIGNFGYVAVCLVGALLAKNDMISFGVIIAFITYVRLFTQPMAQIAQAMTSIQSTAAASERVFEFVDEEEMKDEKDLTKKLNKEDVKGKIEFKDVVFQYDDNDKPTINDFSATAMPGQKIAIVGPTGAGKTTMVNLLMKFYDIKSGDILIDGVSTKDLTRENIHDLFTMVLQDTWLFEGTVKENIVYNREDVSIDEVKEVCKEVGIDHFIRTLPHGYDSVLSENDSVSAGQRQLLTIARAMIDKSPFLILDEATSNVDTRTEELVQVAMDKLTKGKTSFIIAHRLSTIKNADLILVMNEGNIIESGNHEELMNKNGFYAKLYNSQFEL